MRKILNSNVGLFISTVVLIYLSVGCIKNVNQESKASASVEISADVSNNDSILSHPIIEDYEEQLPGVWSKVEPGLFEIYNNLVGSLEQFSPYTNDKMPANCYPRIFYLELVDCPLLDSLKYSWEDDVITSICFEDESMMWSSRDTIYTKGNKISYNRYGEDIGNKLYNPIIINELHKWNGEEYRFETELDDSCLFIVFDILPNKYCKIRVKNRQAVSAWVRIGFPTEQQFENLSDKDKNKYYEFVKRAEQNKRRRIEKKN